jgi:hypothetical protein
VQLRKSPVLLHESIVVSYIGMMVMSMKENKEKRPFTARARANLYIDLYLYELHNKVNKIVMGTVLGNPILLTSIGDPLIISGPQGVFEGQLTHVQISEEQDDRICDRLHKKMYRNEDYHAGTCMEIPILTLRARGIWKGTEDSLDRQFYRGIHYYQSDIGEPFRLDMGPVEGMYGVAQTLELYQERKRRYQSKFWYTQSPPKPQPWTNWSYKLTPLGAAKMEEWLLSITDIDHNAYLPPSSGEYKNMRCANALEYVYLTVYMDYNRIDPKHSVLEDWATLSKKGLYEPLPTPRRETFDDFCTWLGSNFFKFDDQLKRHEGRYRAQPTPRNRNRLERYRSEVGLAGLRKAN